MRQIFLRALGIGLLAGNQGTAQPTDKSIQGVWQAVEVTLTGPGARTIVIPEPRPNLTIITARHYSRIQVETATRPVLADPTKATADDLRAAWGPFVGEAGTYEIDEHVITMHPIVAKNPKAMTPEAFNTWSYKLSGDTLWVTAERNQDGPVVHPVTVKAVRIE